MIVTSDNIKDLNVSENEKKLLHTDLIDIEEINSITGKEFFIHYQDWHDEYSPERTDPCPDYYGCFSVREKDNPYEDIGLKCATEDCLQTIILTIYDTCIAIYGENHYEVGDGWIPLIKEAEKIVREWNLNHPDEPRIKFIQIKEKYGGLRLYVNAAPKEIWSKLDELEEKSYGICEFCGATKNVDTEETHGWIYTLCDKCRKKEEERWTNMTR